MRAINRSGNGMCGKALSKWNLSVFYVRNFGSCDEVPLGFYGIDCAPGSSTFNRVSPLQRSSIISGICARRELWNSISGVIAPYLFPD